jgi:hypothetical protein
MKLSPVTRSAPCCICGKPSWCSRSEEHDMHSCMRSTDAPGGYRYIKETRVGGHLFAGPASEPPRRRAERDLPPLAPPPPSPAPPRPSFIDWEKVQRRLYDSVTMPIREAIEEQVRIPHGFLAALGMGWSAPHHAYSWPMRDERMQVTGIHLRTPDAKKFAIKGSKQGIYAVGRPRTDMVLLCEGVTDTAAMLSLGYEAIGRPSCRGAEDICAALCAGRHAVVVADADGPGRAGAQILAMRCKAACRSVRIIEPIAVKDARAWVLANGSRAMVDTVIRNAIAC